MPDRVAILGGGVAGLSAAHELIQRGFAVDVYEASKVVGGKARSLGVDPPGAPIGPKLPGEHGFRFFPAFYRHLPQTMREILDGGETAFDRLVDTRETLLAREEGKRSITTLNRFPATLLEIIQAFESISIFYCDLGVPKSEVSHFIRKLLGMLVSCDDRRFGDYEFDSWSDYLEAASQSQPFRDYLVVGLSRSLVALNASELSARTGACILLQFLIDFASSTSVDRVLDRPTNEAWLTPWQTQLKNDGVQFHFESPLLAFNVSSQRIVSARVKQEGAETDVHAEHYIAALPVEKMQPLLGPLIDPLDGDPSLATMASLCTSWMTGIIFFLSKDIPIIPGHSNYLDSNWALTSISQAQFWPTIDLSTYGDGTVRGILSVIISNWDDPLFAAGPKAKECTKEQVRNITWQQLKDHLNTPGQPEVLSDGDRVDWFLAPCLECDTSGPTPSWTNDEPLFINTKGSWDQRPEAVTGIENLYLASDYVRTHTDLATMESANEAARRAVNGILDRTGSGLPRCDVFPLEEPAIITPLRVMDEFLYNVMGADPLVPPIPTLPWPCP